MMTASQLEFYVTKLDETEQRVHVATHARNGETEVLVVTCHGIPRSQWEKMSVEDRGLQLAGTICVSLRRDDPEFFDILREVEGGIEEVSEEEADAEMGGPEVLDCFYWSVVGIALHIFGWTEWESVWDERPEGVEIDVPPPAPRDGGGDPS